MLLDAEACKPQNKYRLTSYYQDHIKHERAVYNELIPTYSAIFCHVLLRLVVVGGHVGKWRLMNIWTEKEMSFNQSSRRLTAILSDFPSAVFSSNFLL